MIHTVLALDLDVTKAGVALPTRRLRTLRAPTINVTRNGVAELGRRLDYWDRELTEIIDTYRPSIIALEAAIPSPGFTSTCRKAEVHGIVRRLAYRAGAHLIDDIYPGHLKLAMTGNGAADKAAMVSEAMNRGYEPANDDEADAALLREYVVDVITTPAHRRQWLLPV